MTATGVVVTPHPVTGWVEANAVPLATIDPAAPMDDLAPLRKAVGSATVVGLGESLHDSHEEAVLKHRALRYLVEELGFRTIAWEEDWTVGHQVNAYIGGGEGDLDGLMRRMTATWRTREVADVLRWLRDYNAANDDKVEFVGVEVYATGLSAYDAVAAYIAEHAPGRLAQAERHLKAIRPPSADIGAWANRYFSEIDDKRPYIRHARGLYDLVARLRGGGAEHRAVLQEARQIRSFYEYYAQTNLGAYRDARAAENLRWWRRESGDKIAYWAAIPHTANAPGQRLQIGPGEPVSFAAAGSYLRRWYGRNYVSIAFTFTKGRVASGDVPPPPPRWSDAPLGAAGSAQYLLNLRANLTPEAKAWLSAPAKIRILARWDPAQPERFHMSGGTLGQWFDVIIHQQTITAIRPL
ncbi:MAG TPA: erythromycin esterase family protein [Streptosporangiaceae bacterium]|nr:erythromycin esterase family protein [Streptosporangiaceae bacterium]